MLVLFHESVERCRRSCSLFVLQIYIQQSLPFKIQHSTSLNQLLFVIDKYGQHSLHLLHSLDQIYYFEILFYPNFSLIEEFHSKCLLAATQLSKTLEFVMKGETYVHERLHWVFRASDIVGWLYESRLHQYLIDHKGNASHNSNYST